MNEHLNIEWTNALIGVLGLVQVVVGAWVRGLRKDLDELRETDASLARRLADTASAQAERFAQIEVLVAGKYITREESGDARGAMLKLLLDRLDVIDSKLDDKVNREEFFRYGDRR